MQANINLLALYIGRLWGFTTDDDDYSQWQIDLKQNPNPNVGDDYWLYSLRGGQGTLLTSMSSNTLQGPIQPKDYDATLW